MLTVEKIWSSTEWTRLEARKGGYVDFASAELHSLNSHLSDLVEAYCNGV